MEPSRNSKMKVKGEWPEKKQSGEEYKKQVERKINVLTQKRDEIKIEIMDSDGHADPDADKKVEARYNIVLKLKPSIR